jgi:hypothetical protein
MNFQILTSNLSAIRKLYRQGNTFIQPFQTQGVFTFHHLQENGFNREVPVTATVGQFSSDQAVCKPFSA